MANTLYKDSAVSPVIGVLLMLVVTIIIAAVVSGFAGGLAGNNEKTASASVSAKYSQSQGLRIDHMGGDAMSVSGTSFIIRESPMLSQYPNQMNAAELLKANFSYTNPGGPFGVTGFKPGDSLFMSTQNVTVSGMGHSAMSPTSSFTDFTGTDKIGKTFYLEMYDKNGKMITKTDVVISP